jgi:hypothetical protein
MANLPIEHQTEGERRLARYRVLAEFLVREGLLKEERIPELIRRYQESGLPVTVVVAQECNITEKEVAQAVADSFDLPFVDVTNVMPDPDVLHLLSAEQAHAYRALPLRVDGNVLTVAKSDPIDLDAEMALADDLDHHYILHLEVAEEIALTLAIEKHFGPVSAGSLRPGYEES